MHASQIYFCEFVSVAAIIMARSGSARPIRWVLMVSNSPDYLKPAHLCLILSSTLTTASHSL